MTMISFYKKKQPYVLERKKSSPRLSPFHIQIIIGVVVIVVLALFVALVGYITHRPSFQIASIDVVGGVTIPHAHIEEKIEAALIGEYMRLIPKRFILFYPREVLTDTLEDIPRIKQVHVEYVGEQTLSVAFDEYVPFALWCERKDAKECLFIDTLGFAFAKAPSLEGSAFVRYVEETNKPALHTSIFASDFLKSATLFSELLTKELNLYVTHVEKKGAYDVEYTISSGGVIKVSQESAPETIFENLKTILSSKEFVHIAPGDFEYIDLRFGDKVFVREEQLASSTASTTSTNE